MLFLERRMLSAYISQQPYRKMFYFPSFLRNGIGKAEDVWTAFGAYLFATALEAFFHTCLVTVLVMHVSGQIYEYTGIFHYVNKLF